MRMTPEEEKQRAKECVAWMKGLSEAEFKQEALKAKKLCQEKGLLLKKHVLEAEKRNPQHPGFELAKTAMIQAFFYRKAHPEEKD